MQVGTTASDYAARKVRSQMAEQKRSGVDLAKHLHISQQSASRRVSGDQPFSLNELFEVAVWLRISIVDLIRPMQEDQR